MSSPDIFQDPDDQRLSLLRRQPWLPQNVSPRSHAVGANPPSNPLVRLKRRPAPCTGNPLQDGPLRRRSNQYIIYLPEQSQQAKASRQYHQDLDGLD